MPQIRDGLLVKRGARPASGATIGARPVIRASVADAESGVALYEGTFNGEWLLMAYDPERNVLEWERDEDLPGGEGVIAIQITDNAGNTARREIAVTVEN